VFVSGEEGAKREVKQGLTVLDGSLMLTLKLGGRHLV
jgi:hypothetical protein